MAFYYAFRNFSPGWPSNEGGLILWGVLRRIDDFLGGGAHGTSRHWCSLWFSLLACYLDSLSLSLFFCHLFLGSLPWSLCICSLSTVLCWTTEVLRSRLCTDLRSTESRGPVQSRVVTGRSIGYNSSAVHECRTLSIFVSTASVRFIQSKKHIGLRIFGSA